MITYTTGNLLESPAQALVNTVNCEGYMGKGIAYQFKLKYPENNKDYIKACKNGTLRIGKLHYYYEDNKLIINFPTKDKWREKSKIEYIDKGLDELIQLFSEKDIKSVAIPPLGSGNGGLIWNDVKTLIESKLTPISQNLDVYIYEPSRTFSAQPKAEPKLSASALVLMEIKQSLTHFSSFRLQKTAFFMNVFSGQRYFKFSRCHNGPYDYSIEIICKAINEYQKYHGVSTKDAQAILYKKIVSDKVTGTINQLAPFIDKASKYVNSVSSKKDLECISTISYLLDENEVLPLDGIIESFKAWSEDKAQRFSEIDIQSGVAKLYEDGIIDHGLGGYRISVSDNQDDSFPSVLTG